MKEYFENFGHTCALCDDKEEEDFKGEGIMKAFTRWKTIDPTSVLTLQHFNSHSSIVHERRSHLTYFPWTLHPFSKIVMVWQIFMTVIFMFGLIYGPLLILFFVNERKVSKFGSMTIMMASKMVCIFDMIRRFFTGFLDESSNMVSDKF